MVTKKENIGRLLRQASNNLTKTLDIAASHHDLTSQQMSIIDFLSKNEGKKIIQADIERELKIRRSTTTTLLQRMEQQSLIIRTSVDSDKRQKVISLTDKSKYLVPIIKKYSTENNEKLLLGFSESEQEVIIKFLKKVVQDNQ